MEHGGHFRQSELVEQSHEAGPETADRRWARDEKSGDGLRRDMAEDCRGWQRRDASLSRLGSSPGARWRERCKSPGTLRFSPVFEVIGRLLTELVKVA